MFLYYSSVIVAKVQILPERVLPAPLEGATPRSYSRLIGCEEDRRTSVDMSGDHMAVLQHWLKSNKRRKVSCEQSGA